MDTQEYLQDQYRDSSNLDARINLHQQFSTNSYGWFKWYFDQLDLQSNAKILEVGCGPGDLWLENLARIPAGWQIQLSDFSEGMLDKAKTRLSTDPRFQFEILDAQTIPFRFGDSTFDAVLANHMLYHLSDPPATLLEIKRILKPEGVFYTSTIGRRHLGELYELLAQFDSVLYSRKRTGLSFTLDDGAEFLSESFENIELRRYDDDLEVTAVAPLVEYILSGLLELPSDRLP